MLAKMNSANLIVAFRMIKAKTTQCYIDVWKYRVFKFALHK